ncbi:ArnT family glycosyltransferase, partial [Chloroflexota bacterium]
WDYDGLMYHLEGPRQFLNAGRILPLSFISQANGPMLIEMLFTLGIAFGIDQLSKLIHLTYGILLILATYSLGERYLGRNKGWMPAAMLIGTPMVVIIAGFVYIDLAWGLYTVLSIYAILMWRETEQRGYLILGGILTGLMVGTKYFAIGYAGIFLVMILWIDRRSEWNRIIRNLLIFGGVSFLIGMPWYLKNWFLTGNPVYPLFFGGPYWPIDRVQISAIYPRSFGTGNDLLDYLLLPINIFVHQERFSTFLGDLEDPNPWFLLILFFPLVKKKSPELILIFVIVVVGFVYWALGSQQIRFLLPLFTGFSILAVRTLNGFTNRLASKRLRRVLPNAILGAGLIYSLIVSLNLFILTQPLKTVIDQETRGEFLTRLSANPGWNYKSLSFIQSELTFDNKVLLIWDGQSYYCNDRCIPDTDNSLWTYFFHTHKNIPTLTQQLHEMGVTHLLINTANTRFMMEHDLSGHHREALIFLVEEFIPTCTKEIYRDPGTRIYELTCSVSMGTSEIIIGSRKEFAAV